MYGYLLEEVVVLGEALGIIGVHAVKWVELTGELTREGLASLDDLAHNLESLLFAHSWAEWVVGQVTSDSDSSGENHGSAILSEVCVGHTVSGHVRHVLVLWPVLVVVLDNLIEELVEALVRVVGTCVEADTGLWVLDSGEAHELEGNAAGILLILVLLPDFLGEAPGEGGGASAWEKLLILVQLLGALVGAGLLVSVLDTVF